MGKKYFVSRTDIKNQRMNPNNGDMLHAAMHAESNHSIKAWLPACIVA